MATLVKEGVTDENRSKVASTMLAELGLAPQPPPKPLRAPLGQLALSTHVELRQPFERVIAGPSVSQPASLRSAHLLCQFDLS